MKTLDISYLWKLPSELRSILKELGLRTIGDILNVPRDDLSVHLGDWTPWVKEWAFGRDPERVKKVYPEEPFIFRKNFDRPVAGLSKEFLKTVVEQLSAALAEKGVGPREIEVNLEGDFPEYRRTRRFFAPVSSRESLFLAVESLLKDFTGGEIHSFSVKLFDTLPVRRDPLPLLWTVAPGFRFPLELELALEGIQKKFGERALYWGREETGGKSLPPEVLRYEKMMTLWDPVRVQGGVNHVQTRP